MTERFLKFIPSNEAMYLLTQKGHAFRLLTIIAEAARRYEGDADGLHIGEAFIGGFENYDMTEQNYRTAKKILESRGHIKIIETCRTRKKPLTSKDTFNSGFCKNPTIGVTTIGTKVKLLSSTVYDININDGNDRNNDRLTTDQRPTNDKQEQQEVKELKEQQPTLVPSVSVGSVVCSFSCLDGLGLSKEDLEKLAGFDEVDVIRGVKVLKEYKKPIDSVMGYLLKAIKGKWQPKSNPIIQISDRAKSNRDKLMGYADAAKDMLKIRDLVIIDCIDHAMFGTEKLPYEHEEFKELVKSARIKFNLWIAAPKPIVEDNCQNNTISHAGSHAMNLLQNSEHFKK